MSCILFIVIMIFNAINDDSVIKSLFTVAGYTYGPLLGMYAFGLFTKYKIHDKFVPIIAVFTYYMLYFKFIYLFWF